MRRKSREERFIWVNSLLQSPRLTRHINRVSATGLKEIVERGLPQSSGRITASITWITPLVHSMSVFTTLALSTMTFS